MLLVSVDKALSYYGCRVQIVLTINSSQPTDLHGTSTPDENKEKDWRLRHIWSRLPRCYRE